MLKSVLIVPDINTNKTVFLLSANELFALQTDARGIHQYELNNLVRYVIDQSLFLFIET